MSTCGRLLDRLALLTLAAALAGAALLERGSRLPAHWDASGTADWFWSQTVALTHVPALLGCLWAVGRLRPADRLLARAACGAAAAVAAVFAYSLAEAYGLGAYALLAPAVVAALFGHTAGRDLLDTLRRGVDWDG